MQTSYVNGPTAATRTSLLNQIRATPTQFPHAAMRTDLTSTVILGKYATAGTSTVTNFRNSFSNVFVGVTDRDNMEEGRRIKIERWALLFSAVLTQPKITNTIILNSVTPHPGYNWQTLENDFTLLKLAEKVDFAQLPHAFPACWPSYKLTKSGQNVRINKLQENNW